MTFRSSITVQVGIKKLKKFNINLINNNNNICICVGGIDALM